MASKANANAKKAIAKNPAKRAAPAKRVPRPRRAGDPGDTADIAEEYSLQDQRREARDDEAPSDANADEEREEMTTGTVQDQLTYQGLAENRENSGDLKRAEKARDALADRTAAVSHPGSDADKRAARRRASDLGQSRKHKSPKRT